MGSPVSPTLPEQLARAAELPGLLATLVAIRSPSGDEGAAADFVQAWLAERGLASERVGQSVVAHVDGAQPGPTLSLNSHLDTVPPGEGWEDDPWRAQWDGDRLTGLGATDAKGCVAAMLWATAALAERHDWAGTLQLSLHAEEETVNRGMTEVLEAYGPPDAAITGEPTGLEVVRSQAGLAVLTMRWTGRSCHAAHVARVAHDNALLRAARELATLPAWLHPGAEHSLLGKSTLAVTVLHSGDRHNKVPDLAEAVADGRLVPPTTAADCVALLREHLPTAEIGVRSERLGPKDTPADDPLVVAAVAAAGRDAAIGSTTLSDMALLPSGVPAVKVGPGDTARSHTPNEYLLRAELEAGAAFYERCAHAWLTRAPAPSAP